MLVSAKHQHESAISIWPSQTISISWHYIHSLPSTNAALLIHNQPSIHLDSFFSVTMMYLSLVKSESVSCSVLSDSLRPHEPSRLLCPWNFLGKKNGVGSHSILQGIFPTQALNLGLLHCRQILYHLCHQGNPLKPHLILYQILSSFAIEDNILTMYSIYKNGILQFLSISIYESIHIHNVYTYCTFTGVCIIGRQKSKKERNYLLRLAESPNPMQLIDKLWEVVDFL